MLNVLLISIIQGITEFLPISSSAHIKIIEHLFEMDFLINNFLLDLTVHLGSLLSILVIFKSDIIEFLFTKKIKQLIVASLPLLVLPIFKNEIKTIALSFKSISTCFIISGIIIFIGTRSKEKNIHSLKDFFIIGISQALAIFPGASRSGFTISSARILGLDLKKSIKFSFIISIPAILGASTLEFINAFNTISLELIGYSNLIIAFIGSFLTGFFTLKLILKHLSNKIFIFSSIYCVLLGITIRILSW